MRYGWCVLACVPMCFSAPKSVTVDIIFWSAQSPERLVQDPARRADARDNDRSVASVSRPLHAGVARWWSGRPRSRGRCRATGPGETDMTHFFIGFIVAIAVLWTSNTIAQ